MSNEVRKDTIDLGSSGGLACDISLGDGKLFSSLAISIEPICQITIYELRMCG
jgi:hypothetical protein